MTVRQILLRKGAQVHVVGPDATLAEAASRLRLHDIGALLVLEGDALVGILSERDLVRAVAQEGGGALRQPVRAAMSSPVQTCDPADEVRALMARMTTLRIRHLPVLDAGRVAGIVSIGDVVKSRVVEVQGEADSLQDALTLRWASALAS
jgi:CBS domain-containing protein